MKLSLDWLREWLPLDEKPEAIAERLTSIGLAVDGVNRPGDALGEILVARVEAVDVHPQADRLSLCRVFDGREKVDVVCGAPNVTAGGVYPFAPVGATLPGGQTIRRAKIRGARSHGMLCSARELELSEDAGGLLELDRSLEPGTPLNEALGLSDAVLELDVPYNRPDWLAVRGVARELAAVYGDEVAGPQSGPDESGAPARDAVTVALDDVESCPLYSARIVRGVRVGPSPPWLARRLEAIGQRSINNVVDVTNYVLHTYAQPIHAFDLDTLRGGEIRVRRAEAGEQLTTLDGRARTLTPEVLVIADGERAVALGGIMGGVETEVTGGTTALLLEAAWFHPARIRAGVAALGLETDASTRFARGVDREAVLTALDHTARWIAEVAGGEVAPGRIVAGGTGEAPRRVRVRHARIAHLLGSPVEADAAADILSRLGFAPEPDGGGLLARVPSWRPDVTREEDLIEEVARLHGYDRFEARSYNAGAVAAVRAPAGRVIERSVNALVGLGLREIVTPALTRAREAERSKEWTWASGEPVRLLNARSEETNALRTALWPGHLAVVRHNLHHGAERCRFFEHDKVFAAGAGGLSPRVERWELAGALAEPPSDRAWSGEVRRFDLFALKGILTAWCRSMGLDVSSAAPLEHEALASGEAFALEGASLRAVGGRISPALASAFDVPSHVWLFAVDLDPLLALTPAIPCYKETSRFPQVKRDLAFVVPAGVRHADLVLEMRGASGGLLRDVRLFDVYEGRQVPEGHKSLAYALAFRADDRSLENAEVDRQVEKIVARVSEVSGATLRDS